MSSGPILTYPLLLPLLAVSSTWYNFLYFWSGRSFKKSEGGSTVQ